MAVVRLHLLMPSPSPKRRLRCAIYTRKSTEAGLEQDFNSLDAQREASEAYIRSQAHEGWVLIPTAYDDGGYSGGSMDRPGLQALLKDVEAGSIDIIVVYKVDRLTRSLADFAKLVELFDARGVSFVSVTQSFNTTSSMGRLTLNVLLSFAQFEREVTGERIRDKIAASKRKGLWMGGPVPLGYRVENRKLVIVGEEADRVRLIFTLALHCPSLAALLRELRERGVVTKAMARKNGTTRGGISFTKGPITYLLGNRTYLGELVHKRAWHKANHPPILAAALFDAVQAKLRQQRTAFWSSRAGSAALLLGRIFDDRGNRMSPATARKQGVRYRYYVSRAIADGDPKTAGSLARVAAPNIEAAVVAAIRTHLPNCSPADDPLDDRSLVHRHLERVEVARDALEITIRSMSGEVDTIAVPWHPRPGRVARQILMPAGRDDVKPMCSETRITLLTAIAKARAWADGLLLGRIADIGQIAKAEKRSERQIRSLLPLAFIAPDIIEAAIDHRLPEGYGVARFVAELPVAWDDQRTWIGLPPR
jgi:site-specific DNA recombinase